MNHCLKTIVKSSRKNLQQILAIQQYVVSHQNMERRARTREKKRASERRRALASSFFYDPLGFQPQSILGDFFSSFGPTVVKRPLVFSRRPAHRAQLPVSKFLGLPSWSLGIRRAWRRRYSKGVRFRIDIPIPKSQSGLPTYCGKFDNCCFLGPRLKPWIRVWNMYGPPIVKKITNNTGPKSQITQFFSKSL